LGVLIGCVSCFAQHYRNRTRQRLGQYNNSDTNELEQADFSIAYPLTEFWVKGTLASLGLNRKSYQDIRISDFTIGSAAQPWYKMLLGEWRIHSTGEKGFTQVQRILDRAFCGSRTCAATRSCAALLIRAQCVLHFSFALVLGRPALFP
jgi:hypothetical protein